MLHDILFALSGNPSPLLRTGPTEAIAKSIITTPEGNLLRTASHLSELQCNLTTCTNQLSSSHPSIICRAVSTAIKGIHLAAFRHKVLEVEENVLRRDSSVVSAYDIVPLTAVIGEFTPWMRRLEWLWELAKFMSNERQKASCTGAQLVDRLRSESHTGYADVEETALSLVKAAEMAWLKQVGAWIFYGRLPNFGSEDFFIQKDAGSEQGYRIDSTLLPSLVSPSTATSMLFIGTSLNRLRNSDITQQNNVGGLGHLSVHLQDLANLTFPLHTTTLSRTVNSVRLSLSRETFQKLLPKEKVIDILHLLREFFLLGNGAFAMALTQQADEKIRSRWRRSDNLAYEKRDGLGTIMVKEGEVTAVLARTWATLGSMQNQHADEDEELERARELLRLSLAKSKAATPIKSRKKAPSDAVNDIAKTPFRNLLFSVPVVMNLHIPAPEDLFLTTADTTTYSSINSYLLSVRRAHLRLTDLWKISSMRRHHPPPPRPPFSCTKEGRAQTRILRERSSARSSVMRSAWATTSATIFFLAETEAYLQVEVVAGLWEDFYTWLTGRVDQGKRASRPASSASIHIGNDIIDMAADDDVWMHTSQKSRPSTSYRRSHIATEAPHRDPQTLSIAHRTYLRVLTRRLLLTQASFTQPLYELLIHIDHLIALVHRLHGIWTSKDLETDQGVVDAFVNLDAEEIDVKSSLVAVGLEVKRGVEDVISVLRDLSVDSTFLAEMEDDGTSAETDDDAAEFWSTGDEEMRYIPKRIGGVERLLMKLDFGGWFDTQKSDEEL